MPSTTITIIINHQSATAATTTVLLHLFEQLIVKTINDTMKQPFFCSLQIQTTCSIHVFN